LATDLLSEEADVTIIEGRRGWQAVDLRELWRYRELLYFFTWRDIKVRYKQTVFGFAWAVAQPLVTMVVFTVIFGRLVGLENRIPGDLPYPVFVFAGLLPWQLFSKAMTNAGVSVVGAGAVIQKIYFPRVLVPIASVGSSVFDFGVASLILLAMMLWYGIVPGFAILLLPVLLFLIVVAALTVGIWLSALTVRYRDLRIVVGFAVQILMYMTPVIYPVTLIPEPYRWLVALNPLAGLIDGFRFCLLGQPMEWTSLITGSLVTLAALPLSALYFRRMESTFADIV
jgi:lipopolysaccharide transport system permease protein